MTHNHDYSWEIGRDPMSHFKDAYSTQDIMNKYVAKVLNGYMNGSTDEIFDLVSRLEPTKNEYSNKAINLNEE